MTIQEKVEMQARDTSKVYLYREGVFYKAYNEGAFMLDFLKYKVAVKWIKNINQTIYSIGFPLAALDKLAETHTMALHTDYTMLTTDTGFIEERYALCSPVKVFSP
jgi:hypothetical protein